MKFLSLLILGGLFSVAALAQTPQPAQVEFTCVKRYANHGTLTIVADIDWDTSTPGAGSFVASFQDLSGKLTQSQPQSTSGTSAKRGVSKDSGNSIDVVLSDANFIAIMMGKLGALKGFPGMYVSSLEVQMSDCSVK